MIFAAELSYAQPGGGGGGGGRGRGPILSPEQLAKVWQAQSDTVAGKLELAKEDAGKLGVAYKSARESHDQESQKIANEGGGGGGGMMAMMELNMSERGKLETALKEFISGDKLASAMASLGTFNRQADRMVNAILELNLDAEKNKKALLVIDDFTVANGKSMEDAIASGDFQSIRTSMQEQRAKVETDLAAVLSPEQLEEYKAKTATRRRGDGQGGPGGGGPGGQGGGRQRGPGAPPSN
jgi:hypothetical protein